MEGAVMVTHIITIIIKSRRTMRPPDSQPPQLHPPRVCVCVLTSVYIKCICVEVINVLRGRSDPATSINAGIWFSLKCNSGALILCIRRGFDLPHFLNLFLPGTVLCPPLSLCQVPSVTLSTGTASVLT